MKNFICALVLCFTSAGFAQSFEDSKSLFYLTMANSIKLTAPTSFTYKMNGNDVQPPPSNQDLDCTLSLIATGKELKINKGFTASGTIDPNPIFSEIGYRIKNPANDKESLSLFCDVKGMVLFSEKIYVNGERRTLLDAKDFRNKCHDKKGLAQLTTKGLTIDCVLPTGTIGSFRKLLKQYGLNLELN